MILCLRGVNNCWLQLTDILMKEGTWRGSIARLISGYAQNVGRLGDVAVTNTLPDCFASCLWIKFYKHADWQVLRARVAMFVIKVRVEFHFRIIFARYSNPFKVFMRFQSMIFLGLFPRNYFRRFFRKYYDDFASSRKHSGCSFDRLA